MSAPDAPNTKPQATEADVPQEDLNYKEVLDKVAHEARNPPQPDAGAPAVHPLVEKGRYRGQAPCLPFEWS